MNVKKRKLSPAATAAIGVAVVFVMALGGWFLLISPQRARAAELDTQIEQVERQVTEARAAASKADAVEPIRVADLFRLSKAMPADTDIAGMLLELSRIAAETGITFESIVPKPTNAGETFRSQPIDLVFVGDFYTLSDFLYRLRNLVSVQRGQLLAAGRLFVVDSVRFVEAESSFPHIKAMLTVSAFLYGSGPAGAAAPAAAPAPAPAPAEGETTTDGATETAPTTTDGTTTTPSPDAAPAAPSDGTAPVSP